MDAQKKKEEVVKKWKVWQKEWIEKQIWEGTDEDAARWGRFGYLVEEYKNKEINNVKTIF